MTFYFNLKNLNKMTNVLIATEKPFAPAAVAQMSEVFEDDGLSGSTVRKVY